MEKGGKSALISPLPHGQQRRGEESVYSVDRSLRGKSRQGKPCHPSPGRPVLISVNVTEDFKMALSPGRFPQLD
jgi:hypothetical protein